MIAHPLSLSPSSWEGFFASEAAKPSEGWASPSSQSPSLMEGSGVAPGKGSGGKSEFDFPPVLYVDLPLYGMTYTLAVQVVQRQ